MQRLRLAQQSRVQGGGGAREQGFRGLGLGTWLALRSLQLDGSPPYTTRGFGLNRSNIPVRHVFKHVQLILLPPRTALHSAQPLEQLQILPNPLWCSVATAQRNDDDDVRDAAGAHHALLMHTRMRIRGLLGFQVVNTKP